MDFTSEPSPATQTSAPSTGNEQLDRDIERLAALGFQVDVLQEAGQIGVVVRAYPLSPGAYIRDRTSVLLKTDLAYPQSAMDMFWVDADLMLAGNRLPAGGESVEVHFGLSWRRYSWHRNTPWKPGRDDLVSHFEFCAARLQRAE